MKILWLNAGMLGFYGIYSSILIVYDDGRRQAGAQHGTGAGQGFSFNIIDPVSPFGSFFFYDPGRTPGYHMDLALRSRCGNIEPPGDPGLHLSGS